jgi:hypothetical protein
MTTSNLTLEEQATNYVTLQHIQLVQKHLHIIVKELLDRGELHDQSKLEPPGAKKVQPSIRKRLGMNTLVRTNDKICNPYK